MSDSLLLKGLFISIYRTFSLNCRRLQQTKKCTTLFLQEKVSKIIDLTREAFSVSFNRGSNLSILRVYHYEYKYILVSKQ